jgi:hypothetical protein
MSGTMRCVNPRRKWPSGALILAAGLLLALSGCGACDPVTGPADSGSNRDGGIPTQDAGEVDSGTPDAGGGDADGSAGPLCGPDTPGFGEPCAANAGDPLCGQWICNPMTDELFCYDLGPNDCGGCEDLDTTEGLVGDACGEFGCGTVICSEDGESTVCEGDHPRNVCDGCEEILIDAEPGEVCSTCGTGVQTCTRDLDDLLCWRGREPTTQCGGCGRCVLYHAYMDQRFSGGYVRTGTLALIEDIGDSNYQLVFDPLVEGPGADALSLAQVIFSIDEDPTSGLTLPLNPFFAESLNGTGADPIRAYRVPFITGLDTYEHVVIYDYFLQEVISVGALVSGPPPGLPGLDAGPIPDAGSPQDAGGAAVDGGSGSSIDGGGGDAG